MVRERGSGKTPPRVVELLKKEVSDKSILAVSKATGLGLAAIGRYMKGIGEPTTASLEKLADYFKVSVTWLRGEISTHEAMRRGLRRSIAEFQAKDVIHYPRDMSEKYLELTNSVFEIYHIVPEPLKQAVSDLASILAKEIWHLGLEDVADGSTAVKEKYKTLMDCYIRLIDFNV